MSQTIDVSNAVAPVKTKRWQFGHRTLLILMTVCCAILVAVVVPPLAVFALAFVAISLATFCLAATFYGRGWIRPFAIGTGLAMIFSFFLLVDARPHGPSEFSIGLFFLLFGSVSFGLLVAATHGYLKRRLGVVPIPNVPLLRDWLWNPDE